MDHGQARDSLRTIATAQRQAFELRHYRGAGSIVVAWGLVWLIGFGTLQFAPALAHWAWPLGWILALAWTATRPRREGDGRTLASWLVALGFVTLLLLVIEADMRTAAMVFGLVLAASYLAIGIWAGRRFGILGALVLAAGATGWWLMPDWLFASLALGGGGALVLGGLWLQRP